MSKELSDEELDDFLEGLNNYLEDPPETESSDSGWILDDEEYAKDGSVEKEGSEAEDKTEDSDPNQDIYELVNEKLKAVDGDPKKLPEGTLKELKKKLVFNFTNCGCFDDDCKECEVDLYGLRRGWDQSKRDRERNNSKSNQTHQERIDAVFEIMKDHCYACRAGESDFSPLHEHLPKLMFIDPSNLTTLEEYESQFGLS